MNINYHQKLKSISLGKIANLKYFDIIQNKSDYQNNILLNVNTYNSENEIDSNNDLTINKERLTKRNTTFFNKKSNFFNNDISINNIFQKNRRSNCENKKIKKLILNEYKNKNSKNMGIEKNKSEKINSKFDIKNGQLFKNLFYIKTPKILNDKKINYDSLNTLSIIPQITTESTKSTYINNNPKEKESHIYTKLIKNKLNKSKFQLLNYTSEFNIEKAIKDKKSYNELMKKRQKYPFILNPNPITKKMFTDLPKSIKKANRKYFNILKNENDKIFSHYFSIIPKEKFSKKFQNVRNIFDFENYEEKEKEKGKENITLNELNERKEIPLINEKIVSGYKLLKQLNFEEAHSSKYKIKLSKKVIHYKFKKIIIFLSSKLSNLSIYMSEIIDNYKKPKHSYFYPNSHELFFALKSKNLTLVEKILNNNKYLVLDFDYFRMTALHWAAKYNFYQIIPKLCQYGSHTDDTNYIGDTPLLISIKRKSMTSTIFLLLYLASPFIKDKRGYDALYYSKYDFRLNNIIKKINLLHYISILGKTKNRIEYIQKRFCEYILDEFRNDLESDAYNIIYEKLELFKRTKKNK